VIQNNMDTMHIITTTQLFAFTTKLSSSKKHRDEKDTLQNKKIVIWTVIMLNENASFNIS